MNFITLPRIFGPPRIKSGLTQAQVARKLGYTSAQFVSNWERGVARPPTGRARKIIAVLKLDPDKPVGLLMEGSRKVLGRALRS
ncbi:MAG: helix-turn-helix transcriptional regulator [Bdellovibrionaceae bacterium]|nr:helix-turn-helix transcriptional regulator [Pseudobdellovibrionaceae bacterium]